MTDDRSPRWCPVCGARTSVTETRATGRHLRRLRRCSQKTCGHQFSTREVISAVGTRIAYPAVVIDLEPMRQLRARLVETVLAIDSILANAGALLDQDGTAAGLLDHDRADD